jgi:flavin reductase (DIM6/NTAB) family NADH-FMN oxidoreductase RutF
MSFTPDDFKRLMRQHPAAVTLIATGQAPHRTGLTATAVMSMSLDPLSIVCAVNRATFTHDQILNNKIFSVNTLAQQHIALAQTFSGQTKVSGEERFDAADWCQLKSGAPVLKNALVSFDCELLQAVEVGTHSLLIGKVVAGQLSADPMGSPLVYHDGQWASLDNCQVAN